MSRLDFHWMKFCCETLSRLFILTLAISTCLLRAEIGRGQEIIAPGTVTFQQIVLRDLSTVSVDQECRIDADGIYLPDGSVLAWWQVLKIETEDPGRESIKQWQSSFGRDWFLLRSRLQRSEVFGLDAIINRLADRYDQISASDLSSEAELRRWMILRAIHAGDFSTAVLQLCKLRTPDNANNLAKSEAMSTVYRLVADWETDSRTGINWRVPPMGQTETAKLFLQDSSRWNLTNLDNGSARTQMVYQLLAASAIDKTTLSERWRNLRTIRPFVDREWSDLIEALLQDQVDLDVVERWFSEHESHLGWGEKLLSNWVAGSVLLKHPERQVWMQGAGYLLKIGYVQEQMRLAGLQSDPIPLDSSSPESSKPEPESEPENGLKLSFVPRDLASNEWSVAALRLVADKFASVGETGKMESLRTHLKHLGADK